MPHLPPPQISSLHYRPPPFGKFHEHCYEKARAVLVSADEQLTKEQELLARYREQLANCKIYAPQDGMIAYKSTAISSSSRVTRVLEYGLLYSDFENLIAAIRNIETAVPISLVRKNAQSGRRRVANARVLGTVPEYEEVKNLVVGRGRFLTDTDSKMRQMSP